MPALLSLLFLSLPFIAGAQITYEPLVGIPGVDVAATDFGKYLNQLYFLSISVAALIAVVKIIMAGVKWMMTDLISGKSDAKNDIRSSLLGLLLIVSAVLILETINPQLTNLNVLRYASTAPRAPISAVQQDRIDRTVQTPGGGAQMQGRSVSELLARSEFADPRFTEADRQGLRDVLESFSQPGANFSEADFLQLARSASAGTGRAAEQLIQMHNLERAALGQTAACQGRQVSTAVSGQGQDLRLSATCAQ